MISPPTIRLYYDDPSLLAFEANVVACRPRDGGFDVALDRSAFYPTSGGQLHDIGTLALAGDEPSISITAVEDDDAGVVWHRADRAVDEGVAVTGLVDAARRTDHRQQHTGQHVLSASCAHVCNAETRSVHLGRDTCTVDFDRELSGADLDAAEDDANRIVAENREVHVRYVDASEAALLPLRRPTGRQGLVRLIDIEGHDLSACGGTHVQRTGDIGGIVVQGSERYKGGTRVTFVCGARAVGSHRLLRDLVAGAARQLSVGVAELPAAVERLQQELRDARKAGDALREQHADLVARSLAATFAPFGGCDALVELVPDGDASTLRRMASALVAEPGRLAVLLGGDSPHALVVARSADLARYDAADLARRITAEVGGKAGGRPDFAQGGGVTADVTTVRDVVHRLLA